MHGPSCPPVYAPIDLTPPATGPVSVGTMTDDEGRAFIEAAKGPATEPVAALVQVLVSGFIEGLMNPDAHGTPDTLPWIEQNLERIVAAARAEVDVERLARAMHDGERGTDPTDRPYCDRHRRRLPRDRR
jgi:hypothetical protein